MWHEQYGWKDNPFSIKTSTDLIGLEGKKQELLNYIRAGDVCFLNGPTGVGKTSLLKWLEKNLKHHKLIYIDAAGINEDFSLAKYLKNKAGFIGKLTGKEFPKNTVVLVDESQDCNPEFLKALKLHWDHNHIKSIVVTQINPELNFSESFRNRIGNRIIPIGRLSSSEGYELISLRTNNKNPFDKSAIEAILEYSHYIPRKILETCEIACMKLQGKNPINAFDIEEILSPHKKQKIGEIEIPQYSEYQKELEENEIKQSEIEIPAQKIQQEFQDISIKLSPMESSILQHLQASNKTAQMLALLLKTSEGSVGKQLSNLMKKSLIKITKLERPKEYGLVKYAPH